MSRRSETGKLLFKEGPVSKIFSDDYLDVCAERPDVETWVESNKPCPIPRCGKKLLINPNNRNIVGCASCNTCEFLDDINLTA